MIDDEIDLSARSRLSAKQRRHGLKQQAMLRDKVNNRPLWQRQLSNDKGPKAPITLPDTKPESNS